MNCKFNFLYLYLGLCFVSAVAGPGCASPEPVCISTPVSAEPGPCGRGLSVVQTDYDRTEITALGLDGRVLSELLFSSYDENGGRVLSGDVVLPLSPEQSGEIVLIDRAFGYIDRIDPSKAGLLKQATTSLEFHSNPHDYLRLSDTKAYVSRFEPNTKPMPAALDEGSDLLILDPSSGQMLGRIDLVPAMAGEDPAFFPRPDRMIQINDRVYVLLQGYSLDFLTSAESRVVAIDVQSDSIVDVFVLKGLHGCSALSASPSAGELAVGCSGEFAGDSLPTLEQSGLVLLSAAGKLEEKQRWMAADIGAGPLGLSLAYASDGLLLFSTLGYVDFESEKSLDDMAIALNINTGVFQTLLQAPAFALGDVRCAPSCGACFVADAQTREGAVHRFLLNTSGGLDHAEIIPMHACSGLPPRYLGFF